jgi:hypothetical protein
MSSHAQFTGIALILLGLGTWFYTLSLGRLSRRVAELEKDRTTHAAALREAYASHAWALYRLHGEFDRHVGQHGPHDDGDGPVGALPGPPPGPPSPLRGPRRGRPFAFPPTVTPRSDGEERTTS